MLSLMSLAIQYQSKVRRGESESSIGIAESAHVDRKLRSSDIKQCNDPWRRIQRRTRRFSIGNHPPLSRRECRLQEMVRTHAPLIGSADLNYPYLAIQYCLTQARGRREGGSQGSTSRRSLLTRVFSCSCCSLNCLLFATLLSSLSSGKICI